MNLKRIKALLLTCLMLCSVMLFAACGGQGDNTAADETTAAPGYNVKVVDVFGNPCNEGVIVRFMQNGQQVTMQVVDENGVASKDLDKGDYTVELQFTGSDAYYYDQSDLTLTADKTSLEITLYHAIDGEPTTIFAHSLQTDGNKEQNAYAVSVGGTYVELEAGERNYFLFTPTEGGTYQFSVADADVTLGYYGMPHFVQETMASEPVDNVTTVSIKDSMIGTNGTGTTVMVLGLDATGESTSTILKIERIGDPQWDVTDEPWTVYEATIELETYDLPDGATFGEFDLKAASDAYTLVLGEDNFYHMNTADGPLVLVRLGEVSGGSRYLDSLETIINHSGVTKYFFDEDGNFIKKESYTECLYEYVQYVDEDSGLFPLTEDLKYIIQQRGDYYGWFDPESPGYIFWDENGNKILDINPDNAWLLYCCYINN